MKTIATVCLLGVSMALSSHAINRPHSDSTTPHPELPAKPAEILPATPLTPAKPAKGNQDTPLPAPTSQAQEQKVPAVWLGIISEPVHPALISQLQLSGNPGILVMSIGPLSPAKKAGLQEYDIILGINDSVIRKPEDVSKALSTHKAGDKVTIHLIRGGQNKDIEAILDATPANLPRIDGIIADGSTPQGLAKRGRNHMPSIPPQTLGAGGRPSLQMLSQMFRNLPNGWDGDFEEMDRLLDEMLNNSFTPPSGIQQPLQQVPGSSASSHFSSKFNLNSNGISVSVQSTNQNTTIKATDSQGNIIYEGPYNTEEEKAKVPSEVQKIMGGISFSR